MKQLSEARLRWNATTPVERRFVGGRLDGATRECRGEGYVSGRDVYRLVGDEMVFQGTRPS